MTPLLLAAVLLGSSAHIQGSFVVQQPPQAVVQWMLQHQNAVATSLKCRVIGRKDDLVRVYKQTAKGDFDFVVRETIRRDKLGNVFYTTTLVQSISGGMTKNDVSVTLRPYGSGSLVILEAEADVHGLPRMQVQIGLNAAAKGFRRMMEEVFGEYTQRD